MQSIAFTIIFFVKELFTQWSMVLYRNIAERFTLHKSNKSKGPCVICSFSFRLKSKIENWCQNVKVPNQKFFTFFSFWYNIET